MYLALFLQQNSVDPALVQKLAVTILALVPILIIVGIAVIMVPCWFICKKAGHSPWLSLLCLIPSLGTLVLLYILAFTEWKTSPMYPAGYVPQPPYPPVPPQI